MRTKIESMKTLSTVAILFTTILTACASASRQSDQNFDAKSTAVRQFAEALLSADVENAKLLSSPVKWDEIDEWVQNHPPIGCTAAGINSARDSSIPLEFSGGSWFSFGNYDEYTNKWLINVEYDCKVQNINYCFEITDASVERVNEKWQVIGWDAICEKNDNSDLCSSMCK
jgi:hypothetical protein